MNQDPWIYYQLQEHERQRLMQERQRLRLLQRPGVLRRAALRSGLLLARWARRLLCYGQLPEDQPVSLNWHIDRSH